MQLECALTTFPLRELLDLCVRSLITGAVEVEAPAGFHRVLVQGGRIDHAESPRECGFDALWPLFELADAPFRFHAGLSSPERTIDEHAPGLLARAQRIAAEWRSIRPIIANLDVVPQLVVPDTREMVRIDEEHWSILCLADGMRTVREIAAEVGVEAVDACRILLRLHKRGLVRLDQQGWGDLHRIASRLKPPLSFGSSQEASAASYFARLAALPVEHANGGVMQSSERAAQVEAIVRLLGSR